MLKSLNITNAAVAKRVNVDFENGFTVITGETGSGKSVMIDCLQLISGSKSSRDIVRSGENKAVVSAIFEPSFTATDDETDIIPDENGELSLIRVVSEDGRNSVKANGRSITLAQLRSVGSKLLGINTQDEKNFLTDKSEYVFLIDGYADNSELFTRYSAAYSELSSATAELKTLRDELKEKNMMIDILTYQVKEIDQARLTVDDEEEKLQKLRTKIKSIERTEKSRKIVYKALSQNEKGYSAAYLLERASAALTQISDVVDGAADMIRRLDEYRYDILDIAETVNAALDTGISGDPTEKLNQIESRLNLIDKLKRKYGASISEIKAFRADAANKLKKLTESDIAISNLENKIEELTAKATAEADLLRETRVAAAKTISEDVTAILRYLDMPKVKFFIQVIPDVSGGEYNFTVNGADVVDILLSVNPGEDPVTISKVASGGELSRVMLALRSCLNQKSGAETVIFDEIDAGVSGSTSERIGHLLKKISADSQVIAITHSPQIAALADHHFLIKKTEIDGRAESSVTLLDDEARIEEIARIIGGIDVTDKQRAAAREMLFAK